MNAQTLDWSDIPYVLAVCETGSLSAAARKLGVNHSTVFRRIGAAEEKLGVTLFERVSHGYVMTTAGEHFYQQGRSLEDGMVRIQRELGGKDLRLEGLLTVTTTDSLLHRLTPVFVAFQQQYPDVELQILSGTRPLDLMQRDADIALRPTVHPPQHWVGRNLTPIAYAVYAHADYMKVAADVPIMKHRWVRLVDDLNRSPMNLITSRHKDEDAPVTVCSSLMGVFDFVVAGMGIGALPCYMGENRKELVRLEEPDDEFNTDLWVLAHPDIRRSAKVHAFFDFTTSMIRKTGSDFFQVDKKKYMAP